MYIGSTSNPKVKQWTKLLTKKGRKEQKKFIVEGISSVLEALESNAEVECIVHSADRGIPEVLQPQIGHLPVYAVSEAVLKKCTDAVTPANRVCCCASAAGRSSANHHAYKFVGHFM